MKNLSAKQRNGKWWTYGRLVTNKWGNEQASFKRESLQKLLNDIDGDWINLSVFENDRVEQSGTNNTQAQNYAAPAADIQEDDIPF